MIHSPSKATKEFPARFFESDAGRVPVRDWLLGLTPEDRKAIGAVSISDSSHMSCVGNDYGYDEIFSRYVDGVGRKEDVLLAISTSGNSENVLRAALVAKEKGMKVVGLTGKTGGKLAEVCDVEIRVPHNGYADRTQEIHIKIIHSFLLPTRF